MGATPIICGILMLVIGCSQVDARFKVYQGNEVEPHSRPWMAWLLIGQRRVKCGGALIHRKFVLTAASCVQQNINAVTLGDHARSVDEGTEQVLQALNITQHPDFSHNTSESDLALIELDKRASLTDEVALIPILPLDQLTDRIFTKHTRVGGWGYTVVNDTHKLDFQSDVLLQYTADVAPSEVCEAAGVPSDSVCYAPFRDPESITCEGDVGGPMVIKRKGVWHLAGVINGFNVDNDCSPGLKGATKVTLYLDWINSIIKA